ncbi:CDP-diacylglycerol--glycerol-3-phosphate 3-phosphatidyltransferase [Candidatus Palauibacter sp.]|uniref:CDP-diacylglycerol--glycerol-3-phosphate 3-phosphatidyltransferase n=1 Tax=Candidatus Palauibacter sp. TaxID=3101350 RepID=UPI003B0224EF
MNLPNAITSARILAAPVVTALLLQPSPLPRIIAFAVFLVAALSDLWDGHLARARNQVTSFGKIVDPLADKLLLVAALLPVYSINLGQSGAGSLPLFDVIPLWAVIVLLGRELLVTLLRFLAARRGRVVGALTLGKRKALAQNIFICSAILWVAFLTPGFAAPSGQAWRWFSAFLGWLTTVFLTVAVVLTLISAVTYVATFSRVIAGRHS